MSEPEEQPKLDGTLDPSVEQFARQINFQQSQKGEGVHRLHCGGDLRIQQAFQPAVSQVF
jgi:hypothetical protein